MQGIHRIPGVRGGNAYVVNVGQGLTVVDTGLPGNAGRIIGYIRSLGEDPSSLKSIVLTHSDVDHSGSAKKLKAATGARVVIHELDAPRLAGQMKLKEVRGAAGIVLSLAGPFMRFQPMTPDAVVTDGDVVGGLSVLHTPGHTDGSISLLRPGEVLFAGDALRTVGNGEVRPPSRALSADMGRAMDSLRKIAGLEFDGLLPGHGPPIEGNAAQKVRNLLGSVFEG